MEKQVEELREQNAQARKVREWRSANNLNVGTGNEISIKDLALKISKFVNYKGSILWDKSKPDGTPRKRLNINKINHNALEKYYNKLI